MPGDPARAARHAVPRDDGVVAAALERAVRRWYSREARTLPWREPECSSWGVLVSEVMLQQTPVARVEPVWRAWLDQWPTPAALSVASPADAIRVWGRLGYPRRALRLLECARAIVERHDGQVPSETAPLLALPGVGEYTAAAVRAFAFGARAVVLDTNVRRVIGRVLVGEALPAPHLTVAERRRAAGLLPAGAAASAAWNAGVMELGALVCTARNPACDVCPLAPDCRWYLAGRPARGAPARRSQGWVGTDREARGAIMAALREASEPLAYAALAGLVGDDGARADRCLRSLLADGLVQRSPGPDAGLRSGRFGLPV